MVYLLAVGAALANALTSIFQRIGVEDAPSEARMRLRLMTHALKRSIWVGGFLLMIASFLLQALALHLGRLSEVQPVLTTELLFLVFLLATWFRFKVGWRDWTGASMAALGLAGFLLFAQPGGGNEHPATSTWVLVAISCGVVVVGFTMLAMRGARWWRAAMFGSAAAVAYAFTAAETKVVTDYVAHNWVNMFTHWQTYGLAVSGLAAVFLTQNAYHAGPIAASQSTLVLVDPLASICIGIALFGDNLRTAAPWGELEAFSLLVLFSGAILLSTSSLVTGVKGSDDAYSELLAGRGPKRPPMNTSPASG